MSDAPEIRMCWSCVAEDEPPCETCWRLKNIASNLAVVGWLCSAYNLGNRNGYMSCNCGDVPDEDEPYRDWMWEPGCGRSAP